MRRFAGAAAVILTALFGSPALADTLVRDTFVGTTNSLPNANPRTVEAWLEKLLGGTELSLIYDKAPTYSDYKSLVNYYPGGDWDYAVVKYGNNFAAYSDSFNDNLLSVGPLSNGISNIRFYSVPEPTRVPEPAALLLVGAGLAAAAPFVWSRCRRV